MAMPRTLYFIVSALALVGVVALEVRLPSGSLTSGNLVTEVKLRSDRSLTSVTVEGIAYRVRVADSPIERARGLSGTASLSNGEGMLFVFEKLGIYGFWMKDMNYPIDIIWINEKWQVVGTSKNLSPDSFPTVFYPPEPVRYVLETLPSAEQVPTTTSPQ